MIPSRATALACADLVQRAYAENAPRPLVAPIDGGIALAFAGTRSHGDWSIDIESWHVQEAWTDGAGIHKGFAGLADHVFDDCLAAVVGRSLCHITITGHSLGAAIALIVAFRLRRVLGQGGFPITGDVIQVVTFGTPRVGDARFHADYHRASIPTLRVYCAHDPLAHVPGGWGWRHVGDALHIDEDGTPLRDPSSFIEAARYWLGWKLGHLDHSMTGYQIALMAHEHRGFAWPM